MNSQAGDREILQEWWATLASSVAPDTRGLWFGLVDLDVDGAAVRHLYVAGCPEFEPDDGGDWACDYCWWPEGRYVLLPLLAALPDQPYVAVLDSAVELIRELDPASNLAHVDRLEGIAVGFDDGDLEIIWPCPTS